MNILCLQDNEHRTPLSLDLLEKLQQAAEENSHTMTTVALEPGDLAYCFGCLKCWSSETGICVSRDRMPELESMLEGTVLILFLTPVIFGTFSSTMKTLIDKGFGSNLFKEKLYPQLVLGYGEDISDDEARCFLDLTKKHRGSMDEVHPELVGVKVDALVTRSMEDNDKVTEEFRTKHLAWSAQ